MDIQQIVSLVCGLLLALIVLFALFGALSGFRKGIYKTTVKTILKVVLVIVAACLAVPISNLISNIEISGLNSLYVQRAGESAGKLDPPTLQNFVSRYLLRKTDLSPRNGLSVYQRCWNLASSLIAIFVFFIELILIQVFISLVTAIVYNGIFRWIIPAENKDEWKLRRKQKSLSALTSGRTNDDGTASAKKTRKKWHLFILPSTLLGLVQEFVFACIVISPLTGICRLAVENRDVIDQVTSREEDKQLIGGIMDSVESSAIYNINGINGWDLKLLDKASEFESTGGVKVSLSGLVNSTLDIAKPVIKSGAISYDATGSFVINYSVLLSTDTVTKLLTSLAANKQIRALIPPLVEAATSSLTGTNFPVSQLDRKQINWADDINVLSGIYSSRYEYIVQPIVSDTSIDTSKFSLDIASRTDEDINQIVPAFKKLGERDIVKKNRPVILAYAGRYRERQDRHFLPSSVEEYANIDWGMEFETLFKNVLKLAKTLNLKVDKDFDYSTLPDALRESFSDEAKFKEIRKCFLGNESEKGIRDRQRFSLVSVPYRMESILESIPAISQYAKQLDFKSILGDFTQADEKNEISKRFDIRQILFAKDSPIDLKQIDKIDLSDDATVQVLCDVFDKAADSTIFSTLLPVVSKAFFFNADFDFESYRFSLNPYCFNYDDPDFITNRKQVLVLRPKRYKMVKSRNDNSLSTQEKVQNIDTTTIRQLLKIVLNSDFFNSDKETGISSDKQKNRNLYYFIKGLFSSNLFENFPLSAPSRDAASSINWGKGDEGDEGEIDRICSVLDYAKVNSDFIFGSDKKLSQIQDFDAIGKLIETGRKSDIIRPCALEIIDKSLSAYLKNIGVTISFNDRRNERWIDDSSKIAKILELLKSTDLDHFDFSTLDTNTLNALLVLLKDRNIIKRSNPSKDPFGYSLYRMITSQDALKDRGLDSTLDASLFRESTSDPWVGTTIGKLTVGEDEFFIDQSGRIYSFCMLRKAIQDVGIDKLGSGKIPSGFFQNQNLKTSFESPFIRKLFVSFLKSSLNQINLSDRGLDSLDFVDISLLETREKGDFEETLDFINFLYTLSNEKMIDGKSKLSIRRENPFSWSTTNAYPEITNTTDPNYNKTFLEVFNDRVDQRKGLKIRTSTKEGCLLSPIATILKNVREKRDRTDRRTRHQDDNALVGIFASITADGWVEEGNHLKEVIHQRQGRTKGDIKMSTMDKQTASSLRNERNESTIFHRVPIALREEGIKQAKLDTYLTDPDTGVIKYSPEFYVYLGTSASDIAYWANEIDNGIERILGDHSISNLLNGSIDLSNANIDDIDITFRYYLGKRNTFKECRSYLFYNLVTRLTKDSLAPVTSLTEEEKNSFSLLGVSTNAPYNENKKSYRIEELFFSNQKLLDTKGSLDQAKSFADLKRVKGVLRGIFSQLPNILDKDRFALINFDFENRAFACFSSADNVFYRSDFASEVFAGTRNAFFRNEHIKPIIGTTSADYDFYANGHELVNPREGKALNGLLIFAKTVPDTYSIGSTTLPYYKKATLEKFYPSFGSSNPKPDDLIYKTFYQARKNSKFATVFSDKLFNLPVVTTSSQYKLFSQTVTIDLENKTVFEILASASIQ